MEVLVDTTQSRSVNDIGTGTDSVRPAVHTDPVGPLALSTYQRTGVFPFLTLPLELRHIVYEELLIFQRNERHKAHTTILRTCRQILDEASPTLYSKNVFDILVGAEYAHYGSGQVQTFQTIFEPDLQTTAYRRFGWPPAPDHFYKCEHFEIRLVIRRFNLVLEADFAEESALRTIMNFNSVLFTILLKHQRLRSIRFVYSFDRGATPEGEGLSEEFMRGFETRCLHALLQLQGLDKVSFDGFHFEDPEYIALIKRHMLQPRSRVWHALDVDYQQPRAPLPPLSQRFNLDQQRLSAEFLKSRLSTTVKAVELRAPLANF